MMEKVYRFGSVLSFHTGAHNTMQQPCQENVSLLQYTDIAVYIQ